jgi:hypothetical protein
MKILDFPTELLIHIFFFLRHAAEEAPSPGGCLGFVNLAQTCRLCYALAKDSLRDCSDLLLTEEKKAHITLELGEWKAKHWMKTFTPIAAWARRVGRICSFCPNRARHSIHGEAFTGLTVCQVCEAMLLPKVSYYTLWEMNPHFTAVLEEVDSPYPDDEPELWRPYPFQQVPSLFGRSPLWIPVVCDTVWEVQPPQTVSHPASQKEIVNQLTTWTHAKKILSKYKYVETEGKSQEADPYMVEFNDYLGGLKKLSGRDYVMPYGGPLVVGREATWWYFRADKFHWRQPIVDVMDDYGKDASLALYLEFRYRFDPWWHDNKTPVEIHDEFCRIQDIWEFYREVPWQEDQWPVVPPKILILGANEESKKGEYERKCMHYRALCASLRRKFWRDDRLIEKPEACWKAIRHIKSDRERGNWMKDDIRNIKRGKIEIN